MLAFVVSAFPILQPIANAAADGPEKSRDVGKLATPARVAPLPAGPEVAVPTRVTPTPSALRVLVRDTASLSNEGGEDPAVFRLKDPSGDGNSEVKIDIGVAVSKEVGDWDVAWIAEHHRDTNKDSKTDTWSTGGAARYYGGSPTGLLYHAEFKAEYLENRIEDSEGLLASAIFTGYFKGLRELPAEKLRHEPLFVIPKAGLEFQTSNDADGTGNDGVVTRGKLAARATYYPYFADASTKWEVFADGQYWRDLAQTGGFDDTKKDRRMIKLGTSYAIDPDQHFKITAAYVHGENPAEGISDSEYVSIGLSVIF